METYVTKSLSIDLQFHYIYVSSFKLFRLFHKKWTVQELKWGLLKEKTKGFLRPKKSQQQIYSQSSPLGKSDNKKNKQINKDNKQESTTTPTDVLIYWGNGTYLSVTLLCPSHISQWITTPECAECSVLHISVSNDLDIWKMA